MKSKKGLESVEVWMWIIAGLIIGGLIFVTTYTLLSHWIHNNEVDQAQKSYGLLKSSIEYVCSIGTESQEINSYIFPYLVNNISVFNETSKTSGSGNQLCIDIDGEGTYCEDIELCGIQMAIRDLSREDSLFFLIQKALGESKVTKIKFQITKRDLRFIEIKTWEEFVE